MYIVFRLFITNIYLQSEIIILCIYPGSFKVIELKKTVLLFECYEF